MANPVASLSATHTIDGVWLIPYTSPTQPVSASSAWIGAKSPTLEATVSMDIFTIPTRAEEPSQDGVLHRDRGVIEGMLLNNHQDGLTADAWLTRLQTLIARQRDYSFIHLVSTRYAPFKVKLHSLSKQPIQAGGFAWSVSVPFREVD